MSFGPIGKTRRWPDGALCPDDKGELQFSVSHNYGHVMLSFAKPVKWVGMPAETARNLACLLVKHAEAMERHKC